MGDGTIDRHRDGHSRLVVEMTNREFLEWLDNELGFLSTGTRLKETASERAERNRGDSHVKVVNEENYSDVYRLKTRSHPFFTELASWYGSGEKQFPNDLEINSTIAKIWYVCDGTLTLYETSIRPWAVFYTSNEGHRREYLKGLFEEVGFSPRFTDESVYFGVDETQSLLEWMGEPVPGFEYKW